MAIGASQPAVCHREPTWCWRKRWCRGRRACNGYTLLAVGSNNMINVTLYEKLNFRLYSRYRSGCKHWPSAASDGSKPVVSGQDSAGIHCVCKGQPRQAILRVSRHWKHSASRWRTVPGSADAMTYKDIAGQWCGDVTDYVFTPDTLTVKFHDSRPANVFKITKYTYTNDSVRIDWLNDAGKESVTVFAEFVANSTTMAAAERRQTTPTFPPLLDRTARTPSKRRSRLQKSYSWKIYHAGAMVRIDGERAAANFGRRQLLTVAIQVREHEQ